MLAIRLCTLGALLIPVSVGAHCYSDTGGQCSWFRCSSTRNAICSEDHRCVCAAGTCAVDGICVGRSSLVLLASESMESRAEPAAAGAVVLVAAAPMVAAFLVMRRRRTSDIHVPENALG